MRYLLIIFLSLTLSKVLLAEDVTVEMLNKLEKRSMVFSQEIVRINPGDTVFWQATDKGHNVEFMVAPDNIKFKSKMHKNAGYTFTIPGIYTYKCTPHVSTGMVGVVIVGGDLSNINDALAGNYPGQSKEIIHELLSKYN